MRFSHWPSGAHPIFILPDWQDIEELAHERPDTLRICEDSANSIWGPTLAVASGYGNTHQTIVEMVKALGNKRWNPTALILHRENSREWLMNCGGQFSARSNPERMTLRNARPFLEPATVQFWEDFNSIWNNL